MDFKKSIHVAVQSILLTTIQGCSFYLGKSWYQKIQSGGLAKEYKSKSHRTDYRGFFLQPHGVAEVFTNYMMAILPVDDKIRNLVITSLKRIYLKKQRFPQIPEPANTTTNACESFHPRFSKLFNKPHPNVFNFVEVLKGIQCETYIDLRRKNRKLQYNITLGAEAVRYPTKRKKVIELYAWPKSTCRYVNRWIKRIKDWPESDTLETRGLHLD